MARRGSDPLKKASNFLAQWGFLLNRWATLLSFKPRKISRYLFRRRIFKIGWTRGAGRWLR